MGNYLLADDTETTIHHKVTLFGRGCRPHVPGTWYAPVVAAVMLQGWRMITNQQSESVMGAAEPRSELNLALALCHERDSRSSSNFMIRTLKAKPVSRCTGLQPGPYVM